MIRLTQLDLFFLLLAFVALVGAWRINRKAGQPGWAHLVPVYGVQVWLRIAGLPERLAWLIGPAQTLVLLAASAYAFSFFAHLELVAQGDEEPGFWDQFLLGVAWLTMLSAAAWAILSLIATYRIGRRFGGSVLFAVGCCLLPTVMLPVLGYNRMAFGGGRLRHATPL